MSIPIYNLNIPEYNNDTEPNFKKISAKIDSIISTHFLHQKLVIRCLGSQDHPGKTVDELIDIILRDGTDRYNPNRKGDRYENIKNKQIDIFAQDYVITENGNYTEQLLEPFYFWCKKYESGPVRIDIIILYDNDKLDKVVHKYEGRDDVKTDGFIFKEPSNKADAIKGIIKIL